MTEYPKMFTKPVLYISMQNEILWNVKWNEVGQTNR